MFCQLLSESFDFFELFLSFFFFLSFSFLTLAFYMYICVPFSSLSWPPRSWPKAGGTVMTHDRVTVTCHTFVTFYTLLGKSCESHSHDFQKHVYSFPC